MAKFDVAVGMDHTTLDAAAAQLYAAPDARAKIFKGSRSDTKDGTPYTVTYDVLVAPTFDLDPGAPIKALWPQSIDKNGAINQQKPQPQLPTMNLFVLTLPSFHATASVSGSTPDSGTASNVRVFCTGNVTASTLTLTPAAVWIDQGQMGDWDQFLLVTLVALVIDQLQTMLAGLDIPPLTFSVAGVEIDLTQPIASIGGGRLVLASSLKSVGSVDITAASWPTKPLFVLISGSAIQSIAQNAINTKIKDFSFSKDGSTAGGSWDASGQVNDITITSDPGDRQKVSAQIGFGLKADFKPLGIGPCAMSAATANM